MNFNTVQHAAHVDEFAKQTKSGVNWPVLICLLGGFRLFISGQPVVLRNPIRTKALLASLALEEDHCIPRDALLLALWPDIDIELAGQSLNSLVHSLRKLLSDPLGGQPPILHDDRCYRLNMEAGIGIDTALFEALSGAGEKQRLAGDLHGAMVAFQQAAEIYRGDLEIDASIRALVLKESLRARYLTILARLADYAYSTNDTDACLHHTLHMLSIDPCREDAHRLVMHCYVRQGERTQALRQYQICAGILREEFNVAPEAATTALFDQIRLDPGHI